ncbi:unnamed protein product [Rotaria sp. Silwood2]|nr:unnamed protein product [Rotaria sp. Silwood2]CAF4571872.1 unnamed protein product [Rotaria sp. Silwood2]
MKLDLDIGKCIYSDDAILPALKVAENLPSVDLHSSDKRLFQIMNHIQSIPFPESKHSVVITQSIEPEPTLVPPSLSSPEQTLEIVEGMTSIDIHIDESMNENNEDAPFLRLTLVSIVVQTKIKTFDMKFDASLANLIVYHEQFIASVNFLHTSPENPLFLTSNYNGIENKAHVHFSVKTNVSQAPEKTLVNLFLSDLRVLDPYREARYRNGETADSGVWNHIKSLGISGITWNQRNHSESFGIT